MPIDPTATAAILLHGLCSSPEEFASVRNALREAGHPVIGLKLPGYSFDPARQRQQASTHQAWLQGVAEAVSGQRALGRRVVLIGLSSGASLALGSLLPRSHGVDGVVLMSTSLHCDGWAMPAYHWLLPLALYTPLGRLWRYRERPPYGVKNQRMRQWIEREMAARSISRAGASVLEVGHLRENDRLRRFVRRALSALHCPPVLALHAREDEVASPANVALLEALLRTPSFRAVLLPNSHHMITIDNDRRLVVEETLAFVRSIAGAPAVARHAEAAGMC